MKLVVASRNAKKCGELEKLLCPLGVNVESVTAYPDAPDVDETGSTFAENAALKATQVAEFLGLWVIADDSGLEVDHLSGTPGVYSARYAGENASDEENNAKLLRELEGVSPERRGAQFVCHLAVSDPSGKVRLTADGKCRGRILTSAAGSGGFGYDPLFLLLEHHRTFGQLSPIVKSVLSHRARAMARLLVRWPALQQSWQENSV
jgi:XTP/dITP diphosphohydrolase